MPEGIRKVLKENVAALMAASADLRTQLKLSKRSKVSKGTIDRITTAGTSVGVDVVAKLAKAFDLEPWQLLVPGLDPKNHPVLRHPTDAEKKLYAKLTSVMEELAAYQADGPPAPQKPRR
jgi:transcriptional regulator with XRE-family HTH domain